MTNGLWERAAPFGFMLELAIRLQLTIHNTALRSDFQASLFGDVDDDDDDRDDRYTDEDE